MTDDSRGNQYENFSPGSAGTNGGGFTEFSADGQYTAPICQWGLD